MNKALYKLNTIYKRNNYKSLVSGHHLHVIVTVECGWTTNLVLTSVYIKSVRIKGHLSSSLGDAFFERCVSCVFLRYCLSFTSRIEEIREINKKIMNEILNVIMYVIRPIHIALWHSI